MRFSKLLIKNTTPKVMAISNFDLDFMTLNILKLDFFLS